MLKPLTGVRVIELTGLAPVPFCGRILADFGASVTVIKKKSEVSTNPKNSIMMNDETVQKMARDKEILELDLKNPVDLKVLRNLCLKTDVLLDPYRPGVLENMGLDPLIVARITGYGQTGSMAKTGGHDINYVSLSGMLPAMNGYPLRHGTNSPSLPFPPINFAADLAGGGLMTAFGIVMALYQCKLNGKFKKNFKRVTGNEGCIIDCSMTEGVAYIGSFIPFYKDPLMISWENPYSLFSGTCPIYRTYETKDGKYMAVGALEEKFHTEFFRVIGLPTGMSDLMVDPDGMIQKIVEIFKSKTQSEWTKIFEACVTPVLDVDNVGEFKHHQDRQAFVNGSSNTEWIPKPAPRLYTAKNFANLLANGKSKL